MSFAEVTLRALHVYPIKSCRGIAVEAIELDAHGVRGDREWMIVDGEGGFLTQRQHPELARLVPRFVGSELELSVGEGGQERVLGCTGGVDREVIPVRVWKSELLAERENHDLNEALSAFLGRPVSLVRHGKSSSRPVIFAGEDRGAFTKFTDSFPVMMASRASLRDLNTRLEVPVDMDRFRPNLEIDDLAPFQEEGLAGLESEGGLPFDFGHGCSRCVVITRDQRTGEDRGPEPLATLANERRRDGKVYFGVHLLPRSAGRLRVGETLRLRFN